MLNQAYYRSSFFLQFTTDISVELVTSNLALTKSSHIVYHLLNLLITQVILELFWNPFQILEL